MSLEEVKRLRVDGQGQLMAASRASIADHVRAMLGFQAAGSEVFDNGNLIRTQAKLGGVENAFDIKIFTEAYLRPLFSRAIGPFRWMRCRAMQPISARSTMRVLEMFPPTMPSSPTGLVWRARTCRSKGCRRASPGSGMASGRRWRYASTKWCATGHWQGRSPSAATISMRGAMAHPNIMTENMKDGSDAVADWPLLDAMLLCSSQADLVVIHSGGGGYAGYMTSAGVTMVADGTAAADERLNLALTNDTALGVMRYADAGYAESLDEVARKDIPYLPLG